MSEVMITAADVNKLRQTTGAGMMDCKKALVETGGDFEAAIDFLRKKGQKVAANRADRESTEGLAIAKTANGHAVLLVLSCETDFVAINEAFGAFANQLVDLALEKNAADKDALLALTIDGRTVADHITEQVGKIGEKIEIAFYANIAGELVYGYNHPGNQIATIVAFNKAVDQEVGKNVAMQIAAMAPVAIDKEGVTQETLDRELEIAREQVRAEGKPEDMVEKIAQGKVNKFYKESTLNNQEYIKDGKLNVLQYLQSVDKDLKVTDFKRYAIK